MHPAIHTVRAVTEILLVVGLVFYVAWDFFAEWISNDDTISVIILAGVLLGHFLWGQIAPVN